MKSYIVVRFWDQNCQSGANGGSTYLGTIDDLNEVKLREKEKWIEEWKETEYGFERGYHSTINSEFGKYYIIKAGYNDAVDVGGICIW